MRKKYAGTGLVPTLLAICLLAMLITAMLTACTGGTTSASSTTPTSSGNSPNTVHMNDSNFDQSSITIKKGETLTLVNDSEAIHIIMNGTWDNHGTAKGNKEPDAPKVDAQMDGKDNKTKKFGTFNTAGTFQLYCTVHPGMNLTVNVQ